MSARRTSKDELLSSHKSGTMETLMNLIKPFVGAGILALPQAFASGGIVASTVLLFALGMMTIYCMRLLLACSDRIVGPSFAESSSDYSFGSADSDAQPVNRPSPTYPDIGYYAYGRNGRLIAQICVVVSQTGACIAYLSFISENMTAMVPSVPREDWIVIIVPVFVLTSQIRNIKYIAPASALGNFLFVLSLLIIFYYGFAYSCCASGDELKIADFWGLPLLFGTASFALEGIALVLPVRKNMRNPSLFNQLLNIAVAIVVACYLIFSILGYLFFGSETDSVITHNMDDGALSDSVRVLLSLSLFCTYSLQLFPVAELMDILFGVTAQTLPGHDGTSAPAGASFSAVSATSTGGAGDSAASSHQTAVAAAGAGEVRAPAEVVPDIEQRHGLLPSDISSDAPLEEEQGSQGREERCGIPFLKGSVIRVALVAVTAIIAIVFPNFGLIIALVGALSNSLLAFMLPAVFYLKLCRPREELSRSQKLRFGCLPWTVIVGGGTAAFIGVYFALEEMANSL